MGYQSGTDITYEQKKLRESFQRIKECLTEFYNTCELQIQESARSYREIEGELKQKDQEIKECTREKRACDVLDRTGNQLARLYNTIYNMPASESKRELIACITALNSEFANCGIEVIYDLESECKLKDKRYTVTRVDNDSDKKRNGILECTKVGFDIAGERVINAEATEYKYEKGTAVRSELRKITDEGEQWVPLEVKYFLGDKADFEICKNREGELCIRILSSLILDYLDIYSNSTAISSIKFKLQKWYRVKDEDIAFLINNERIVQLVWRHTATNGELLQTGYRDLAQILTRF